MKNILQPTRIKIIIHLLVALSFVVATIIFSLSGFSKVFSELALWQKILSFLVSWILSFIIYYPLTFGLIYLFSSIKNSLYNAKEIILALVFIIIFNPLTLSFVLSNLLPQKALAPSNVIESNLPPEAVCGMRINDFTAGSKVAEAGIGKGDIVIKFNGAEIKSVQDIFSQLAQKKPGDKVSLETDKGLKMVELIKNANDPDVPALGVILELSLCK